MSRSKEERNVIQTIDYCVLESDCVKGGIKEKLLLKGVYKRYDVSKLIGIHGNEENSDTKTMKERYVEQVLERVADLWPEEGNLEEKWMAVQSALINTADQPTRKGVW